MRFFESSKDFQLDRKTFLNLRWIALMGQLVAVLFVKVILEYSFLSYLYCISIILFGILTNFYLQFKLKDKQINNFISTSYLAYDIIQLGCLLHLTGGITNPFIFLIVIPSVFSSKYLNLWSSIFLVSLTVCILILISLFYLELPYPQEAHFHVPNYYLYSIPVSVVIGLFFLVYFGLKFGSEYRTRNDALNKIQIIMAKEHELVSLGGQAAASAHSLGTPLSTISLIAKELKEELGNNKKYSEDISLLISQSNRCNEILKRLSLNPHIEDEFLEKEVTFFDYITEITTSFKEISEKKFIINNSKNNNIIKITRTIEIIFGLRNFIGNANKFANEKITINIITNKKTTKIIINDDGPGFSNDIIDKLGEPYIRSSSKKFFSKAGLGLGTFIGKTLLEKNFATIDFENLDKEQGASVIISWLNEDLKKI